jgi:hypothetical protein
MQGIGNPLHIAGMFRFTSGLGDLARSEIPTTVGENSLCGWLLLRPILRRVWQWVLMFVNPSPVPHVDVATADGHRTGRRKTPPDGTGGVPSGGCAT